MWLACATLLLAQITAPQEWLVGSAGDGFRDDSHWPYFHPHHAADTIFRRHLLHRDAEPPSAGDEGWVSRAADEDGWVAAAHGWAYASIESETDRVVLARLEGASFLYVDGARFSGDRLSMGFGPLPIALRAGHNDVYVTGIPRRFRLGLEQPASRIHVPLWATKPPDLVAGQVAFDELVFPVVNASSEPVEALHVHYGKIPTDGSPPGISEWRDGPTHIVPLGAMEQFGYVASERYEPLPDDVRSAHMGLNVYVEAQEAWTATTEVPFDVRLPGEARRFVFRSDVDGSPQTYALRPPSVPRISPTPRAIVLSLHGPGEDALDQIANQVDVPGVWFVAPDGRSSQTAAGDWWGWQWSDALGALRSVLDRLPEGARRPSVYVAAPEAADLPDPASVPDIVARISIGAELDGLPPNDEPNGGHWIVAHGSTDDGTVGPFVRVEQLAEYGDRYEVRTYRHEDERFLVETDNVRRLTVWPPSSRTRLVVDGTVFDELPGSDRVSLLRTSDGWILAEAPGPGEKRNGHDGPLFEAFDNRFVLVYGTWGDDEENRELLERARADQQRWWALAGGLPPLISDRTARTSWGRDLVAGRNVILYGNAQTNDTWKRFVGDGPVRVERGLVVVGDQRFEGDDLCALFVCPRADMPGALVAAISDTGPTGARLGYAVNPLDPAGPDYIVLSPAVLGPTHEKDGVLAEGWFDHAWNIQRPK